MQDLTLFIHNHGQLCLALVVLLVLLFIIELLRLRHGTQRISTTQVTHLINHQNAVVVDLRPTEVFSKGHIIGAVSLPAADFKEKSKKIDKLKAKPIILVCAKGQDSPRFATLLRSQGFHVHILGGGLSTWVSADLPLVKD